MKFIKMFTVLAFMSLLLSACGDSGGSHHGSWESATLVAENAALPQVVSDCNGNLITVWAQLDGIYTKSLNRGTGWGAPQKIADLGAFGGNPIITLSRNGQYAAIAYDSAEPGLCEIKICDFKAGTGWRLTGNLAGMCSMDDMAIDNEGNLFLTKLEVIMNKDDGEEYFTLRLYHYDKTDGWSNERIDTGEEPIQVGRNSRMALDESGNGFVVWFEYYPDNNYKLFVRRFSQGVIGAPIQLAETSEMGFDWLNIAMDNNGNAMALWGEGDASLSFHTYACRYTMAGGWGAALKIDNSSGSIEQSMTVDPAGNFSAVWSQRTGFNSADIYSCKFTSFTGWQTPKFVGSGGGKIARSPKIAADNRGNLFAAWQQYDPFAPTGRFGGDGKVYGNYCRKGSDWETQQLLSTVPGEAANPSLAVDQSGEAMVIWSQTTGSVDGILSYGVFSSRVR